ncbi:growth arrest-specific protein 1 [Bombina bombina]|uniref:growth arrest-specific protein 1 n=1 Tax=Bombina bombina TaxID=8345 RepID=UPI00235A8977|nr:growth arrest-specific protein 1 [Bombina bombina]
MAGCGVLCLLFLGCFLGLSRSRRLVCWQAMMQCHGDSDCNYAYSQYIEACGAVLPRQGEAAPSHSSSNRRRCPSHCISALIQLNHTRWGPALEDCDCVKDEVCRATKRAIEPCLPRTSSGGGGGPAAGGGGGSSAVMGCTEAKRLCETDRWCSASLLSYLKHCGRLFNGVRCTSDCKAVIYDMMKVPKALMLNDCVCDGMERPFCESIKENMARLCFGEEASNVPGSSGFEYGAEDYDSESDFARTDGSYEDDLAVNNKNQPCDSEGRQSGNKGVPHTAAAWTVLASVLLLVLLL